MNRLLPFFAAAVVAGCAALYTDTRFHDDLSRQIRGDQWQAAIDVVAKAKEKGAYPDKDRLLYLLDMGALHHYAGEYEQSNRYLEEAERTSEELFTASISRAVLSMMLNDNVLEYRGEDYEEIYINVFKALNYIALGQHDEALVEIRRIDIKLQLLTDKYGKLVDALNGAPDPHIRFSAPSVDFHNDALGRYLGALLYYYDGKHDDARIEIENYYRAIAAQPQIYSQPALELSLSVLDTTLLHVMAFTGTGPEKVAIDFRVHTGKNHLLVFPAHRGERFAERFAWEGISEGYYFKFSLPELQRVNNRVVAIEVHADDRYLGTLRPIEDLSRVAEVTFQRRKSLIYLKAIVRTTLKGIAGQKAKEKFSKDDEQENKDQQKNQTDKEKKREKKSGRSGLAEWFFSAAVDAVTEISEQADLRRWHAMPAVAHAGYFPLPEGTYNIRLDFLDAHRQIIFQKFFPRVQVQRSRLNMVEAALLQ
ncbi:MAG: hypothetical protein ONB44_18480 [candidate division KSB1 bacterium]|nr:hypothetical protein [candidate division KSB1 bacterium]MDZ7304117.1 hypothetical protein [candidate division KSB1 bacterium]MDZ7313386.1 hypothetical protein [candidate division KSB1 bacterium]